MHLLSFYRWKFNYLPTVINFRTIFLNNINSDINIYIYQNKVDKALSLSLQYLVQNHLVFSVDVFISHDSCNLLFHHTRGDVILELFQWKRNLFPFSAPLISQKNEKNRRGQCWYNGNCNFQAVINVSCERWNYKHNRTKFSWWINISSIKVIIKFSI